MRSVASKQHMMREIMTDCASKMRDIGLIPGHCNKYVPPIFAKSLMGQCVSKNLDEGLFEIRCNPSQDRHKMTETLFHELVHTLPGCQNHERGFLAACKMVDEAYGTDCELKRMHYHCNTYFKQAYHLVLRFTGKPGERYGLTSECGELLLPLFEIAAVLPDGRREVLELASGRTFVADLVEVRGLRYHAPWQLEKHPDMEAMLRKATSSSRKRHFACSTQQVVHVGAEPGSAITIVPGCAGSALAFETVGLDREGFHVVRNPVTSETFSADIFEASELSYRRRYLCFEAVMRSGIGGLPDTLMKCPARECKGAISALAALIESVWNVNDLVLAEASPARLKGPLYTLDTRLLDAAEKCRLDLEVILPYACRAFMAYGEHRGIAISCKAMHMLAERI